ncbi:MAG: YitT family protein [Eubacterium sp.]|nr:YitT family protein [Eubacterium sp.]
MNTSKKNDFIRIIAIVAASVLMAWNIKSFVRTGGLYPGGVSGLSILLQAIGLRYMNVEIPYTVINVIFNAFPIYIGFKFIGKKFTALSCLMIVVSSVMTDIIPAHIFTYDILLISIFGGLINGFCISICLLVGGTSGGTDFLSIYISQKYKIDAWNYILGLNVIILSIAGIIFGWDKALYSIIFQYASTQVINIMYKRYQKQTLFIISESPEKICDVIYAESGHGATILDGEGSYSHLRKRVIYSVVSREDSAKLIKAVRSADPTAFINVVKTDEISGNFYLRPND